MTGDKEFNMSEQINKVLASTAQSFTTAQQAQARANIGAIGYANLNYSGTAITGIGGSAVGVQDTTSYVPYSSISGDSGFITAINGSGLSGQGGGIAEVYTDSNLSGSGTQASPLGLGSSVCLSAQNQPSSAWYGISGVQVKRNDLVVSTDGSAHKVENTANGCKSYMRDGVLGIRLSTNDGHDDWTYHTDVERTYHELWEDQISVQHMATHDWVGYSAQRTDNVNDTFRSAELNYGELKLCSGQYTGGNSATHKLNVQPTLIESWKDGSRFFGIGASTLEISGCNRFSLSPGVMTWGTTDDPGYMHYQNTNGMFFVDMSMQTGGKIRLDTHGLQITGGGLTANYDTAMYRTLSSLSAWATAQGWTP